MPHREAAKKRRKESFNIAILVAAMAGGVFAGLIHLMYQGAIDAQESDNTLLTNEIQKLDQQIKEIADIESEIAALKARKQAVEDLQADRNMPVHLLTELVKQLPDGIYITKLAQQDRVITINGVAQSNERVSELLRNLTSKTPWLNKPELVEIVAGTVSVSREQKRVGNFVVRVRLSNPAEADAQQALIAKQSVQTESPKP
nr:PilN domain-containing protein [Curvibacter sp. CHRR-16]